jgi:hypothetical protein
MRIAYFTHPSAFNIFGGAEIQILKTKEYVSKVNPKVEVKFFNIFEDHLDDFDVFHNFKMHSDCITISKLAQKKGVKVALSPIYWPPLKQQARFVERQFTKMENLVNNMRTYHSLSFKQFIPFKSFLDFSSIILPNSQMEASALQTL